MSSIRISKHQKKSLLLIRLLESGHGKHIPVNTGFIRRKVEAQLCEESSHEVTLSPNHFLVSLITLADHGYLVYQQNSERHISPHAKENENMWQLTDLGRQYAENYHAELSRPKRQYNKKSVSAVV